ncbi:hypothetical protein LAZ67_X003501, partial [Cordylochernes scorpioides]
MFIIDKSKTSHIARLKRGVVESLVHNAAMRAGHPREQSNQVSAYLDASTIYGSSPGSNSGLRESKGQSARLRTDRLGGYSLLPRSEKNCTKSQLGCDQRCPLTGEKRASSYCAVAQVTPALTSLHTLWVREHNRLVGLLAGRGWTPEKLYQEVRRIISAMMQHITYTEFLPMIMGPEQMGLYQLNTPTKYDPSVRPQVINAFSAAAFRFGHSMVDRRFKRRSRPKMASPRLSQEFFSVHPWCGERLSLDPVGEILGGQSQQRCQKVDFYVTRELTNHLFAERLDAPGLDLLAIDIQRGRDHGLPPYTAWRMACGLEPINSYEDLALHAPSYAVERIKAVYGEENIHDVDLMVGGLAETPGDRRPVGTDLLLPGRGTVPAPQGGRQVLVREPRPPRSPLSRSNPGNQENDSCSRYVSQRRSGDPAALGDEDPR